MSRQTGMLPKDFTGSGSNITDTSAVRPVLPGTLPQGLALPYDRKTSAILVKPPTPGSMPKGFGQPPDNLGLKNTNADTTSLKHEAKDSDSVLLEIEVTEFVGLPADMTMKHANRLLPKVACGISDGHNYHNKHTITNKRRVTWFCVLECWYCRLRIESSCSRFEVGTVKRLLRKIFYKQTTRSRNHRIICIRYDRSEQRGNCK